MNANKQHSSFSANEEEYFNDSQEKFELQSCPIKGMYCKTMLPELNRKYADSVIFRRNRQFDLSLKELKEAYFTTYDLPATPCGTCAAFFRDELTGSMESMHTELKKMEKGLFRTKRYQPVCKAVKETMDMLKGSDTDDKIAV